MNDIEYICDRLSEGELLAQLAEEATELAHAALKLRRTLSNDNPTPVNHDDATDNLKEEIADILLMLDVLGIDPLALEIDMTKAKKLERWARRLECAND